MTALLAIIADYASPATQLTLIDNYKAPRLAADLSPDITNLSALTPRPAPHHA
jgi:hypothetical protein